MPLPPRRASSLSAVADRSKNAEGSKRSKSLLRRPLLQRPGSKVPSAGSVSSPPQTQATSKSFSLSGTPRLDLSGGVQDQLRREISDDDDMQWCQWALAASLAELQGQWEQQQPKPADLASFAQTLQMRRPEGKRKKSARKDVDQIRQQVADSGALIAMFTEHLDKTKVQLEQGGVDVDDVRKRYAATQEAAKLVASVAKTIKEGVSTGELSQDHHLIVNELSEQIAVFEDKLKVAQGDVEDLVEIVPAVDAAACKPYKINHSFEALGKSDEVMQNIVSLVVQINRSWGGNLGIDFKRGPNCLLIERVTEDGLVKDWNNAHPTMMVQALDRIVQVNDKRGEVQAMIEECKKERNLIIALSRCPQEPDGHYALPDQRAGVSTKGPSSVKVPQLKGLGAVSMGDDSPTRASTSRWLQKWRAQLEGRGYSKDDVERIGRTMRQSRGVEFGTTCSLDGDDSADSDQETFNIFKYTELLVTGTPAKKETAAQALAALGASVDNQAAIVEAGALPLLVDLLKNCREGAREQAVRALWQLSRHNAENKDQIARAGAIEPLVHLLLQDRTPLRALACGLLGSLAMNNPENKLGIAKAGALPTIVSLLDSPLPSHVDQATRALWYLTANSPENKVAVADIGAIPKLIAVVQHGSSEVRKQAVGVLGSLSVNNYQNQAAVRHAALEAGCTPEVVGEVAGFKKPEPASNSPRSAPVTLHIYDLGNDESVKSMNEFLRPLGTGAFHAGVEVYGEEWSFGCQSKHVSGIFCTRPRQCAGHIYRESVEMGETQMTMGEVNALIMRVSLEWSGKEYDILRRNCCHFCDAFCKALGVGPPPEWVTNLAGVGATLLSGYNAAVSRADAAAKKVAAKAGEIGEQYRLTDNSTPTASRDRSSDRITRGVLSVIAGAGLKNVFTTGFRSPPTDENVDADKSRVSTVVLQCTHSVYAEVAGQPASWKSLVLKIEESPWLIGFRHQPDVFGRVLPRWHRPECLADAQFVLTWEPDSLYMTKQTPDIILVNGLPPRESPRLRLPVDAEISFTGPDVEVPILAFRVSLLDDVAATLSEPADQWSISRTLWCESHVGVKPQLLDENCDPLPDWPLSPTPVKQIKQRRLYPL